jgi:diketogulonate reductase-like aldo/keto reductase
LDRSEVFLETKIWISDYGYDKTLHGFTKSARKLGVDQIDLLILHQALPSDFEATLEAYRALETLLADEKVRAIGVSNFMVEHLTTLLERATVVPAVNQIEVHPYYQQRHVQVLGAEHGILTQAWSPIGGITFYRDGQHTSTLQDPVIGDIAKAHDKTPAQVMLRWHLQQGRSVIPKSTKPHRIAENIDVFDFDLTAEELAAIDTLDTGQRGGPEPESITLETLGHQSRVVGPAGATSSLSRDFAVERVTRIELAWPANAQGFVTLRSEDRDSTCRQPTVWDALFGCVGAARVRVETAYRRLVTRERMAVLCRGSND